MLRQPTSPICRDFPDNVAKKPAVGGLFTLGRESPGTNFVFFSGRCAENLYAASAGWPFYGEPSRRIEFDYTAWPSGQSANPNFFDTLEGKSWVTLSTGKDPIDFKNILKF